MQYKLPKVFIDWINENSQPSHINNSRRIYTRKITFLYNKFRKSPSEYWANELENLTGISHDFKNIDVVGNE